MKLDDIDRKILKLLQENARMSLRTIAEKTFLSSPAVSARIEKLEQEGLIYPVKGKGNFVAETRQIQEKSKEDFRKEFLELVRRGINTGMTEEELMTLVQKGYEEEKR